MSKYTGNTARDTIGVRSILTTKHTGVSKRPTETRSRLDEVTAEDIKKNPSTKESPMANPTFGFGGERK